MYKVYFVRPDRMLAFKCTAIMWLFRSSFPSGAGQDKPHSISAGIKPLSSAADVKFGEMAPNLLLHSKSQNAGAALRGQVKNIGWSMLIGLRADFSPVWLFPTCDCQAATRPSRIKKLVAVLDLCKTPPADLHLPGFCGISADRAESGLNSRYFAFSQNSTCGAIWGFFRLLLRSRLFLSSQNVLIIGCSTEATNAGLGHILENILKHDSRIVKCMWADVGRDLQNICTPTSLSWLSVCQHGLASVSTLFSPFQQVLPNLRELQENVGLRQRAVGLRDTQMGEGLCRIL